jgi:hypothetical protein
LPVFDIDIYYKEDAEEWRKQGTTEHYSIEAPHMVDAIHKLASRFPALYASDVEEVFIAKTDRTLLTDSPDVIREGDGWKAKEGRDIP